jgi:LAS superfamily LD-carboxypeptidase LdcB
MENIDQQEFRRLIDELNELNRNLRNSKGQVADADPAAAIKQAAKDFDKSSRGIINAIALLSAKIETSGRLRQSDIKETKRKEKQELDKFTNSVERATDAQLSHIDAVREAEQAADAEAHARRKREAAEAEAARRTTLTAKERAEEDKARRKRVQAEEDADLRKQLLDGVKNRNLRIQERTEAKNWGANFWEQMSRGGDATEMFKNKMGDGIAGMVTSLGGGNAALVGVTTGLKGMGAAVDGVTKGIMNYASALYRGERGFTASAKAMTETAKPMLEFVDMLGNIISFASMFVPGKLIMKGAVLLGGQLVKLAGKAGEAALKLNELQSEQLDKTMKAFRDISTVGADTAGGLDDVFDGMQKLGLTTAEIEQFTEVIVKGSKNLAMFGNDVAQGRSKFQDTANALMKSGLGVELERLGMTTKEQTRATMNYMALQARLGTLQNKSVAQLAQESQAYAKEMTALARLTGQSREEAEEARALAYAEDQFAAAKALAEKQGDTDYKQQLENAELIFQMLNSQGRREEGLEVLRLASSRGAATSDRQRGLMLSGYGEAITAGSRQEALEKLGLGLGRAEEQFGGIAPFVPSGEMPYKFAAEQKTRNLLANKNFDEIIAGVQAQSKEVSDRTQARIDTERTQKEMAQKLDSAAFKLVDVAKIHEAAAENLNKAADKLIEWTGSQQSTSVAGGGFTTGGKAPPAPRQAIAPTTAPSPREATETRQKAEAAEQSARDKLQQARQGGAPREDIRRLRTEQQEASRQAERARAAEAHQQKKSGQAGIMGMPPTGRAVGAAPVQAPGTTNTNMSSADISKIFTFGNDSGSRENFDQLNEGFKAKLIAAATEFNSATGQKIIINSAYRSYEDQKKLWDESIAAGREGKTAQGRPIARPGSNNAHTQGIAVDIQNWQMAESFLNKHGLDNPIRDDDVHFMKYGGIVDAKLGGTRALLAEAGMNEAVVPLPDGRNIPVSLNIENLVNKMQLKQVDFSNDLSQTLKDTFTNLVTNVTNQNSGTDTNDLAKQISKMNEKLTDMLDVLNSSKDIQGNLLSYSMN